MPGRDGRGADVERDLLELSDFCEESIAPSPALRETFLATVSEDRRFEGFVARVATFLDFGREQARALLERTGRVAESPWEDGRAQGVRLLHFDGGPRIAEAHCGLVYIEPGVAYPAHRHHGDEWSFVLQGTAREDTGRVWAAGDVVRNPAGSHHSFMTVGSEPFVFVVVVDGEVEHL